jgi:hypothetical protein
MIEVRSPIRVASTHIRLGQAALRGAARARYGDGWADLIHRPVPSG